MSVVGACFAADHDSRTSFGGKTMWEIAHLLGLAALLISGAAFIQNISTRRRVAAREVRIDERAEVSDLRAENAQLRSELRETREDLDQAQRDKRFLQDEMTRDLVAKKRRVSSD